jgi:hypothetical protein
MRGVAQADLRSLALALVTLRQVTAPRRDQILAESPVSYLTRAEGLQWTTFVHRATGALGRVSGIDRRREDWFPRLTSVIAGQP